MENTVIVCTNNLVPKGLLSTALTSVFAQAAELGDTEVIIVSHFPVTEWHIRMNLPNVRDSKHERVSDAIIKEAFFDPEKFNVEYVNLVVGEKRYALRTIVEQFKLAIGAAASDKFIVCEHDVFYPYFYLDKVSKELDRNVGFVFWKNGIDFDYERGYYHMQTRPFSRYSFRRDFSLKYLDERIDDGLKWFEPVFFDDTSGVDLEYKEANLETKYRVLEGDDVLDVHHGFNTTGRILVNNYEDDHPYWGSASSIKRLIDQKYVALANESSKLYAYGLDVE